MGIFLLTKVNLSQVPPAASQHSWWPVSGVLVSKVGCPRIASVTPGLLMDVQWKVGAKSGDSGHWFWVSLFGSDFLVFIS